jgi:hypothetical protein
MSGQFPEMADSLSKYGFNVIFSEELNSLYEFENRHADIQCLKINDTIFLQRDSAILKSKLKELGYNVITTYKSLDKKYPNNVLLNGVYINNKFFCKDSAIDEAVRDYCNSKNIEIINVNQGYTKCSTAVIDDKFITADKGIFNTLTESGVEGLLIKSGSIDLQGVDYGFIGGCCFSYGDNVYFTGDISLHPDYKIIKDFCEKLNKNIVCLSNNRLYDIGGFVVI